MLGETIEGTEEDGGVAAKGEEDGDVDHVNSLGVWDCISDGGQGERESVRWRGEGGWVYNGAIGLLVFCL